VLIFQDEMEIHRHPSLTRMWASVGQQPEVPAPGKNEKKVVYGGVDYKTGKLTYTLADTKCGTCFLAFLTALLLAYAGRKIRLVCDNGRFHTTKAVQTFLAEHRDQFEVYWLPPYCPSLNLIERLWGHLKRTVLANVLYQNLTDLVAAFSKGARRLTAKRECMSFMFGHVDVKRPLPRNLHATRGIRISVPLLNEPSRFEASFPCVATADDHFRIPTNWSQKRCRRPVDLRSSTSRR
jgi:transposase